LPLVVVGLALASGFVSAEHLLALLAAVALILLAARRPDRALLLLIVLLPFQPLLLAKLYAWGVPASIVRPLAGWKEALGIGVIVAGFLGFRASRKPLDRLDWIALSFVGIVFLYALLPQLFAPGAPTALNIRSLDFRQTAGFVLLFWGARHARLPAGFLARAARVALAVGTVIAAIAIYEHFFSSAWNDFIVHNVKYSNYQVQILHTYPLNPLDYRSYGHLAGIQSIRVGSVFLDPLTLGFYLLIAFAIGIDNVFRRGARPYALAALTTLGAALIFTQARSALIGALVIGLLAVGFAPGRRGGRRIQFAFVLLIGLLLAVPAASSSGLAARLSTTKSTDDPGASDHFQALSSGVQSLSHHPLGLGLGTSAGVGQRFEQVQTVPESSYLQIGNEIGIPAMALFIWLTIAAIRALRRAATSSPNLVITPFWTAAAGLAVGAFFLHAWNDFAVSWTIWGLAGAAIGVSARERAGSAPPGAK
jgi:hypothetical protein